MHRKHPNKVIDFFFHSKEGSVHNDTVYIPNS